MPNTFMTSPSLLFSSESVTEGHPDKICDQISDAVLDWSLTQTPTARVACEAGIKSDEADDWVAVFGEVTAYFRNEMYERINFYTLDAISVHQLDMPNFALDTMAFWLVPDGGLFKHLWAGGPDTPSCLAGVGYATPMVLPPLV